MIDFRVSDRVLPHDQFGRKEGKEGKRKEKLQNSSTLCLWGGKKRPPELEYSREMRINK